MERGDCSEEGEETSVQTTCGIHRCASLIDQAVETFAGDNGSDPQLTDTLNVESLFPQANLRKNRTQAMPNNKAQAGDAVL
jgi:hypothetical protein